MPAPTESLGDVAYLNTEAGFVTADRQRRALMATPQAGLPDAEKLGEIL